jgi:ribosomal protein S18 acetylase RimI-like enzyme
MFLFEIGAKITYRQAGIAKQLIEELKNICRAKGITQMFVLTSSHNEAANSLYKATGAIGDNTSTLYSYFF